MFSDISILNFLIYAAGIGFAAAIVYTNIQRTALSRFICFLADNNCNSESTAVTLDNIELSAIQKTVIKSAVKNQYGFRRSVAVVSEKTQKKADDLFDGTDNTKYFLCDSDTEALKKKYSYKTMPTRLVILFVAILATVVIIVSLFFGWFIDVISMPKTDSENKEDIEQSETVSDANLVGDITEDNESGINSEENPEQDKTAGPRIPV